MKMFYTFVLHCLILSICTDIKKMPLGKLSKQQIAKGFEALEEIEDAIKKKSDESKLTELTSKFFTIIPHNFGRNRPPVIRDDAILQDKKEMLLVRCAMYICSVVPLAYEWQTVRYGIFYHVLSTVLKTTFSSAVNFW